MFRDGLQAHHHERLIVMRQFFAEESTHFGQNAITDFGGSSGPVLSDGGENALLAEFLIEGVSRFQNSVREDDEKIARTYGYPGLKISSAGEDPEHGAAFGEAADFKFADARLANEQRRQVSGIDIGEN